MTECMYLCTYVYVYIYIYSFVFYMCSYTPTIDTCIRTYILTWHLAQSTIYPCIVPSGPITSRDHVVVGQSEAQCCSVCPKVLLRRGRRAAAHIEFSVWCMKDSRSAPVHHIAISVRLMFLKLALRPPKVCSGNASNQCGPVARQFTLVMNSFNIGQVAASCPQG